MTTPRLVPLRRITLVEPLIDRHPAHRDPLHNAVQRASTTHATYLADTEADDSAAAPPAPLMTRQGYTPPLDHTASAVAARDAAEAKPGRITFVGPEPVSRSAWPVVLFGVLCFAAGWVLRGWQ
jgi:hypothetical protein